MNTYRIKISCCNCYAEREYDIERGVPHADADLVCPNCGCCPTELNYRVITDKKTYGNYSEKHITQKKEE